MEILIVKGIQLNDKKNLTLTLHNFPANHTWVDVCCRICSPSRLCSPQWGHHFQLNPSHTRQQSILNPWGWSPRIQSICKRNNISVFHSWYHDTSRPTHPIMWSHMTHHVTSRNSASRHIRNTSMTHKIYKMNKILLSHTTTKTITTIHESLLKLVIFNWTSNMIPYCIGLALYRSVLGPEDSYHSLNQSYTL